MHHRLTHLLTPRWWLRRRFPPATLSAITAAIGAAERQHGGEIRFAIETCLDLRRMLDPDAGRRRAIELFAQLRVWDTARNNGVLIYVLLADQAVEIVADRAAARAASDAQWQAITTQMTRAFRAGRYRDGLLGALDQLEVVLSDAFAATGRNPDELPNRPALL